MADIIDLETKRREREIRENPLAESEGFFLACTALEDAVATICDGFIDPKVHEPWIVCDEQNAGMVQNLDLYGKRIRISVIYTENYECPNGPVGNE